MTYLKRCVWSMAIAVVAAGGVSAQTTTTNGLVTTTTGGGTTTTGGGIGGGQGAQSTANQTPEITSTSGGFSQSAVQSSNIIAPFFANPLYQGAGTGTGTTITGPGGFGAPLFSGTGTSAGGTGGRATAGRTSTTGGLGGGTMGGARAGTTGGLGGTTGGLGGARTGTTGGLGGTTGGLGGAGGLGATGRTGGLGGTTGGFGATGRTGGTGGFGGTGANSTNQQLSTGRSIAYTQTLKFGVPPLSTSQLQTDIQSAITSSSTLSSVNGLQAVATDGGVVILRGKVADEDEARLVEGLFLITPGVKGVQSELQYPKP